MYHEIASNLVGVYVRVVAPSEGHPSRTLMTSDLQRSWRWWNGGINDAFDFWIDVEVFEDPAAVGTLTWMMRAAGARSVVVVRTTCRGLVTPAAEAGCSAADRAFVAAFGRGRAPAHWRASDQLAIIAPLVRTGPHGRIGPGRWSYSVRPGQ